MKKFGIWPAVFDGYTMNNIDSVEISANLEAFIRRPGGETVVKETDFLSGAPTVQLQTRDVLEAWNACDPLTAPRLREVDTNAQIKFRRKGSETSDADHLILTGVKGRLYVNDVGAEQNDPLGASLSATYVGLQDGANKPFVSNITTLTGTPAVTGSYKLGPLRINDVEIEQTGWRIRTGIQYATAPHSGNFYPEDGAIDSEAYMVEFTIADLNQATVLKFLEGKTFTANALACYLRKIGEDDTAAEHLRWAFAKGSFDMQTLSVSGTGDGQSRISVNLRDRPVFTSAVALP